MLFSSLEVLFPPYFLYFVYSCIFYSFTFILYSFLLSSKHETTFSHLEALFLPSAPFARLFSRFWRVSLGLLLHLREAALVNGVDSAFKCSNREMLFSLLEVLFSSSAPIVRCCSRNWSCLPCFSLHFRASSLAFGGCRPAFCSICEMLFSRLEVLFLPSAPFVRGGSRIWSCLPCFSLHFRASSLAFGGLLVSFPSNRESIVSLLEVLFLPSAPIVRPLSRFWRVYCCASLHL